MPTPNTQTLWHVPYQRNPFFTGREDVLTQLHRALQADATVALSHPQGISGLGGIGKTQTALEYAYRYGAEYQAVLWVRADSVAALTSSFVELAHVLNLPERNEQDQSIIVEAVLRWFRRQTGWLLVFDNMDDLSVAKPFLPQAGPGHVVFTTRAQSLGGIAQRLDVQKMEPEIGALLLLRRADILPLAALLDRAKPDDQGIARAISQELDGLPLALDQAGAYIKEAPCPLQEYLPLYQTRRNDILGARGRFDQDYPASVATTWSLSFEKVSQANPAAAELLNFCAYLSPDAIPEEILIKGATHLGPVLSPIIGDPMQLDLVCKEVLRYSLFQREADAHTLTIHRLVQEVLRDNLHAERHMDWKQRAVLAVNEAFPVIEFKEWVRCARLLPHALVCAAWIEHNSIITQEASYMLAKAGTYLRERAQYSEAEPLLVQAFSISERRWGAEHPAMARSLYNLANLYLQQGKYKQAELLYQRALSINEQHLGADHPDTAANLNNLAVLYRLQGEYEQAGLLYQRALSISEQHLGVDHPNTARSLSNLAVLYCQQGKYEQAEPLYQRVLSIWEQHVGVDHPNTAKSLDNLALLYKDQGKYEQAESLSLRALSIREQLLGADHPDTANSLNNLALLRCRQGKYEQAEPLFQRAFLIYEQLLGTNHPDIARSLDNLAECYYKQDKCEQAEPLFQRALSIREGHLGTDHPDIAYSLHGLANLYRQQRKYEQAETMYKRALAIREQRLGSAHPETQTVLKDYTAFIDIVGHDAESASREPPSEEDR